MPFPPDPTVNVSLFVGCVQTIERMFCRLKDWRRIATRYDRLARNYLSALALAAAICFWTK
jgi:transposase